MLYTRSTALREPVTLAGPPSSSSVAPSPRRADSRRAANATLFMLVESAGQSSGLLLTGGLLATQCNQRAIPRMIHPSATARRRQRLTAAARLLRPASSLGLSDRPRCPFTQLSTPSMLAYVNNAVASSASKMNRTKREANGSVKGARDSRRICLLAWRTLAPRLASSSRALLPTSPMH